MRPREKVARDYGGQADETGLRTEDAVLDAPRSDASWGVCRFPGGPGCGLNVCTDPVGYHSNTTAV